MKQITREELTGASVPELKTICEDLRGEILKTVSECGGHLSSNLGAVELTVALHRVFCPPADKIVFDVGHQCYTHKLLSDRAARFGTLRQEGGISGFPKREESEYDCYDTGHAGTAISAALGIAKARDLKRETFEVIALVGDGSFQNGLIYEALNSLRILKTRILIILNDNGMSISPTVGGAHDVLNELKSGSAPLDDVRLFERFGLSYLGVCNGNDFDELLPAMEEAKRRLQTGSVLLHVTTKKGQGYPFSEHSPVETHGISPENNRPTHEYSEALGEELCRIAAHDPRVVAVTAAMTDSLGLRGFFDAYPDRAFDVGICEEHAAVLCASMASQGMKPYYAIYSTFLQRAFDEIIHDVCGQGLPVTFCIDRAGITGADGETHQGIFDLSYLSMIPNLTVAIPRNIGEFRSMIRMSAAYDRPLAIRYPREGREGEIGEIEVGKFEVLHSSMSDIIVLAAGERCVSAATEALRLANRRGTDFTLVNARFLKPLDVAFLSACRARRIVTVEDNVLIGGLCDAVRRFCSGRAVEIVGIGYPDAFIPHGDAAALFRARGIEAEHILAAVEGNARG